MLKLMVVFLVRSEKQDSEWCLSRGCILISVYTKTNCLPLNLVESERQVGSRAVSVSILPWVVSWKSGPESYSKVTLKRIKTLHDRFAVYGDPHHHSPSLT